MLEDKGMIIIAVSRYAGAYADLPGTIISARKLRKWAEHPDADCNYKVLYLADDVFKKIDVQLVREKVSEFVENNFLDRLVVYFAGHGIVRSAGEQFWLLTNAANDLREGINVESFRRGLMKCNIGTHNGEVPGQLCIIGDACRNTGRDAIDFSGDPILTSAAKMNTRIQLDRFLSTGLGDYSFQINEAEDRSAYCLFSEVLLGALWGEAQEAIEIEDHRFKPVVTNHSLAEYLEKEIRTRATEIEEEMEPDLLTGIRPPYNFYRRMSGSLPQAMVGAQDSQLLAAIPMAIHDPRESGRDEQWTAVQERRRKTFLEGKQLVERGFDQGEFQEGEWYTGFRDYHSFNFTVICDFLPNLIAAPRGVEVRVDRVDMFHEVQVFTTFNNGSPILISQDKQWTLTPHYPNVVTVIFRDLPGDTLYYKPRSSTWDTYLSDFSHLVRSAPLRAAAAKKFADKIRIGKKLFPHQSVTAGYLYEFSNDYDNIARTAHYMAENGRLVPFDLALLCAENIFWREEDGQFIAFADLPAVEVSQNFEEDRPYYAITAFEERKNVQLWGIAPIYTQGWSFMQTEKYLEIPESIRLIGEKTSGRSAASLTNEGLEMFLEAFNYQVIKTDT
jgi:Caspase domain